MVEAIVISTPSAVGCSIMYIPNVREYMALVQHVQHISYIVKFLEQKYKHREEGERLIISTYFSKIKT